MFNIKVLERLANGDKKTLCILVFLALYKDGFPVDIYSKHKLYKYISFRALCSSNINIEVGAVLENYVMHNGKVYKPTLPKSSPVNTISPIVFTGKLDSYIEIYEYIQLVKLISNLQRAQLRLGLIETLEIPKDLVENVKPHKLIEIKNRTIRFPYEE